KSLIRLICNSDTYQTSSAPNEHNRDDQQNYSRFYPRRLQAEVLADAINQLTNGSDSFRGQPAGARAIQLPDDQFAREFHFLAIFGRPNMASACECERTSTFSLAQAVQLVNSKETSSKLASPLSRVSLLLRDGSLSDQDRIKELYLRAFSRPATASDLKIASDHLSAASGDRTTLRASYEDLVWVLLNSREFIYNH
ncbi:MAG TPA: S-layer protein, partial [Verrucomicrobiales bacterium]|nr:S-layer protein [Verrucomicrobiales bacterium]